MTTSNELKNDGCFILFLYFCFVVILLCLADIFVFKWDSEKPITSSRVNERLYEILYVQPPKHFYVDVMDTETHKLFKLQGSRKHCSRWKEWSTGMIVKLKTEYYTREGSTQEYVRLLDVDEVLCG